MQNPERSEQVPGLVGSLTSIGVLYPERFPALLPVDEGIPGFPGEPPVATGEAGCMAHVLLENREEVGEEISAALKARGGSVVQALIHNQLHKAPAIFREIIEQVGEMSG